MRNLSPNFIGRIQYFTSLAKGWDGYDANAIPRATATRARYLAFDSLVVAPEPFAAPAADGSILLKWDFENGAQVEFFVEDDGDPVAAVTFDGRVHEVEVSGGDSGLLGLLKKVGSDGRP